MQVNRVQLLTSFAPLSTTIQSRYYLQGTEDKEPRAYIHGSSLQKIVDFVRSKLRDREELRAKGLLGEEIATDMLLDASTEVSRFETINASIQLFVKQVSEFHRLRERSCPGANGECLDQIAAPQQLLDAAKRIANERNSVASSGECEATTTDQGECSGLTHAIPEPVRDIYRTVANKIVRRGKNYLVRGASVCFCAESMNKNHTSHNSWTRADFRSATCGASIGDGSAQHHRS